jgi:alpha/beta hydrolase fold
VDRSSAHAMQEGLLIDAALRVVAPASREFKKLKNRERPFEGFNGLDLPRRSPSAMVLVALVGLALSQPTPTAQLADDASGKLFTSSSMQVGKIRWHHMVGGSGDVVVLLHGWPQTWFEWRDVMPYLAKRYRVIAADLPGLGDTSASENYDKKTLAQHLRRLIAELKIESFHLVGHEHGWNRCLWICAAISRGPQDHVSCRERTYLTWFFQTLAHNRAVFSEARVDRYVHAALESVVVARWIRVLPFLREGCN